MTPIDKTEDRPAYQQIADELREQIYSGVLPENAKLPSERELSDEYDVARVTIRNAIAVLRNEGLIFSEHGRGVFVRRRRRIPRIAQKRLSPQARTLDKSAFLADIAETAYEPSVKVTVSIEGADSLSAELLNIDGGDEVIVRDRVMFANGEPVQLAISKFTRRLAGGTQIEQENTGPGGVHARLAELGREPVRFIEKMTVHMPGPEIRKELRLDDGVPVIHITRVALDSNNFPVEVNYMTLAADRYELIYEFSFEEND